jgi:hypothetical protein
MDGHPIIDIVLPTYRMEPDETERFYPSKAKQIGDKIIADELNGAVFDEDDAKNWSLNISDKVREAVCGKKNCFCVLILADRFAFLNFMIENLSRSRFKIVVQTTIGQLKDQGIRVASRCLWDANTDNYASCQYSNVRLFRFHIVASHHV